MRRLSTFTSLVVFGLPALTAFAQADKPGETQPDAPITTTEASSTSTTSISTAPTNTTQASTAPVSTTSASTAPTSTTPTSTSPTSAATTQSACHVSKTANPKRLGVRTSDTNNSEALANQRVTDKNKRQKIIFLSDQVEYVEESMLKLDGNVEISQEDYLITSDTAEFNQDDNSAKLSGTIKLSSPDVSIQGDSAAVNMRSKQTSVDNASFQSKATGFSGSAKRISQEDANTLVVEEGFFTTCPQPDPDWAIQASHIKLDQESGFGIAKHTRLEILDVPVLYVPWFTFPIDDRRKSGFLYPSIGTSNAGSGLYLSTPYYFNIAPDLDATYIPTYIQGRGLHSELEVRHLDDFLTHGRLESNIAAGYLSSDHYYDQEIVGFAEGDARWGLSIQQRFDFDINRTTGWHGDIDFSQISDVDYINDLNQGLQIDKDDYIDRHANLYYSDKHWQFSTVLQDFETLDDDILPEEESYQRVPEVTFSYNNLLRTKVSNSDRHGNAFSHTSAASQHGWLVDWESQYTYFYKDSTKTTTLPGESSDFVHGSRFRHRPSISYLYSPSWGYIKPGLTIDHTDYLLEAYGSLDKHQSRTVPIVTLDSGLYFDRYTSWLGNSILHSLEPRAFFVHANASDQDHLPDFDSSLANLNFQRLFSSRRFTGGDRIGDENRLSVGLSSRWTDLESGRDLAVLSVGQIYHYDDRNVGLEGAGQSDTSESLLATEIQLSPYKYTHFHHTTLWSDKINKTQESFSQLSFHSEDYRYIGNLSHRYRRDDVEQIDSSVILPLAKDLSLLGRWRYELQNHRTIGTLAGLEYRSCCWRVQLLAQQYLDSDSDIENAILFKFQLNGLGNFGEKGSRLDKQIPGYSAREENFN